MTPTAGKRVTQSFIEADFIAAGNAFRLRNKVGLKHC